MNTTAGSVIPFTGLQRQYNNIREEILNATDTVLRSGILMDGEYTRQFTNWIANKNRSKYAVLCHSGTQALEIIALYFRQRIGIQPPTVIIPALTYPATANAWIRAGWNIYILDTDNYGQMDYRKLPDIISYQAVCLVGLYGQSVWNSWDRTGDLMIEDAAQHWLSNNGQRHSEAAAISFDPTKNLANYGNGGAIVSYNKQLIDFARDQISNGKYFKHSDVGTNSRMSEVDCAQMMVKTKYINQWQQRRAEIVKYWMEQFKNTPAKALIDQSNYADHCYHKFVLNLDHRDKVKAELAARKIETKIHYEEPLQELPAFQEYQGPNMLAASYSLSRRCLSLPIYPELTDSEVEYISQQVLDCV